MTNKKNRGVNPMVAAVAGGVVGAGMAVAGAMALTSKKTQDEMKDKLMDIKDQAADYVKEGKEKLQDIKDVAAEYAEEGKDKVAEVEKIVNES